MTRQFFQNGFERKNEFMTKPIRVLIVGDHPHAERVGEIRSQADGTIESISLFGGPTMFKVYFDDDEACFCGAVNMRLVESESTRSFETSCEMRGFGGSGTAS